MVCCSHADTAGNLLRLSLSPRHRGWLQIITTQSMQLRGPQSRQLRSMQRREMQQRKMQRREMQRRKMQHRKMQRRKMQRRKMQQREDATKKDATHRSLTCTLWSVPTSTGRHFLSDTAHKHSRYSKSTLKHNSHHLYTQAWNLHKKATKSRALRPILVPFQIRFSIKRK